MNAEEQYLPVIPAQHLARMYFTGKAPFTRESTSRRALQIFMPLNQSSGLSLQVGYQRFGTDELFTYSGAVILSVLLRWLCLETLFCFNETYEGAIGREAHKSAFSTRLKQLVPTSTVDYETSN
jgi:hypothetical protein